MKKKERFGCPEFNYVEKSDKYVEVMFNNFQNTFAPELKKTFDFKGFERYVKEYFKELNTCIFGNLVAQISRDAVFDCNAYYASIFSLKGAYKSKTIMHDIIHSLFALSVLFPEREYASISRYKKPGGEDLFSILPHKKKQEMVEFIFLAKDAYILSPEKDILKHPFWKNPYLLSRLGINFGDWMPIVKYKHECLSSYVDYALMGLEEVTHEFVVKDKIVKALSQNGMCSVYVNKEDVLEFKELFNDVIAGALENEGVFAELISKKEIDFYLTSFYEIPLNRRFAKICEQMMSQDELVYKAVISGDIFEVRQPLVEVEEIEMSI